MSILAPASTIADAFSALLNDPELIKAITVKDFDHFVNHGFDIDDEIEPLFGRNLFNMADEKWRNMRSVLSPLFTGSKMRGMLALMNETINEFVSGVREDVVKAGPRGKEFNLMDLFTCSTNDRPMNSTPLANRFCMLCRVRKFSSSWPCQSCADCCGYA